MSLSPVTETALHYVAPLVNVAEWSGPLAAAFDKFGFNTCGRIAAALGQFLVEAGPALQNTVEDLNYSRAVRLAMVFPREFPDAAAAQDYVENPAALGNLVYANRNGNGDAASGDGYLFRGRGLIQITGRTAYTALAAALDMQIDAVPAYCETPAGAAMSGCWYLATNGCLPHADAWNIDWITRAVNGPAMAAAAQRASFSNSILKALGGTPARVMEGV